MKSRSSTNLSSKPKNASSIIHEHSCIGAGFHGIEDSLGGISQIGGQVVVLPQAGIFLGLDGELLEQGDVDNFHRAASIR